MRPQATMIHEKGDDIAPAYATLTKAVTVKILPGAGDAIQQIWCSLFSSPDRTAPRTIVVTSAEEGEGTTNVAAALAVTGSSSDQGKRVSLVDANLHNPQLARIFGIAASPGLMDVLTTSTHLSLAMVRGDNPRLRLLPVGTLETANSSLLQSESLRNFVDALLPQSDHVIFDAPPINRYAIAHTLASIADGVVIVTRAGSTRREAVAEAKKRVELAHGKVLGVVLNQRQFHVPPFLYKRM